MRVYIKGRKSFFKTLLIVLSWGTMFAAAGPSWASDYESLPVLNSVDLLGQDAVVGTNYQIGSRVINDGRMNSYVVSSSFYRVTAYGDFMALERAREMEAISTIRKIKTTDAYARGIENAASGPLALAIHAMDDPVGAVQDLSKGLSNMLTDMSSSIGSFGKGSNKKGGGQILDDEMLKNIIGYNNVKRRLAGDLNVDPYSSNDLLQKELGDLSWAVFAGGATIDAALYAAPMAGSLAVHAAQSSGSGKQMAWSVPPATLLEASEKALKQMGVGEVDAEKLLYHPVCTVSHQTALVSALAEMEGVEGRNDYVRSASLAGNEASCRAFQQTAELMWLYHRNVSSIKRLIANNNHVFIKDSDGTVTLPLLSDYFAWTRQNELLLTAIPKSQKRWTIWLSGRASPKSRLELASLNIDIQEKIFQRYPEKIQIVKVLLPKRFNELSSDKPKENRTKKLFSGVEEAGKDVGSIVEDLGSTLFGESADQKKNSSTETDY